MPKIKLVLRREITAIYETTYTADAPDHILDDFGALNKWVQREVVLMVPDASWQALPVPATYHTVRDYKVDPDAPRD